MEVLTLSIRDRLIRRAPTTHERISPIVPVFSGNVQVKAIKHLSQNDTQILIDVVDEVIPFAIPGQKDGLINFFSPQKKRPHFVN